MWNKNVFYSFFLIQLVVQLSLGLCRPDLDEAKVFHNDSNINNYMVRRGRIYIIDFGFSKEITAALCKNLKTERPNYILMTIGFIMEAKRFFKNCPKIYDHILKSVSKENAKKYGLL